MQRHPEASVAVGALVLAFAAILVASILLVRLETADPLGTTILSRLVMFYFLLACGPLAVTIMSSFQVIADQGTWRTLTTFFAFAAGLVNAVHLSQYMGVTGYYVLYRDVAATFALVAAVTLASGAIVRRLHGRNVSTASKVLAMIILMIPLSVLVGILQLLVHCTSGDCL